MSFTVTGLCIYCRTYGNVPVPAGCVAEGGRELAEALRTFVALNFFIKVFQDPRGPLWSSFIPPGEEWVRERCGSQLNAQNPI